MENLALLVIAVVFFVLWLVMLSRNLLVSSRKADRFAVRRAGTEGTWRFACGACVSGSVLFVALYAFSVGAPGPGLALLVIVLAIMLWAGYVSPYAQQRMQKIRRRW